MVTSGQAEKPPKRSPRFDFSSLADPTSLQTARKWAAEVDQRAVVELSLDIVLEDPDNPRTRFDEVALQVLAKSIAARRVMQPILVRERGSDGTHVIIQGARRYRASVIAGKTSIPAIIIPNTELHLYDDYSQVIENIQRENLNAEDIYAFIVKRLAKGDKKVDIAEKLGLRPQAIASYLAFEELPENILALFRAGKIEGIEPLCELNRLRAKAPEVADRLIAEAEETNLGEITRAMIRRAFKSAEDMPTAGAHSDNAQPQNTGLQVGEGLSSKTAATLTHSSPLSASSVESRVGEGLSFEAAATDSEEDPAEEVGITTARPLMLEPTHEGDQNTKKSIEDQVNTVQLPYHNPDAHKASGSGDGWKPDPSDVAARHEGSGDRVMDRADMKLDWKDAEDETPPKVPLLLVIEERNSKGRAADMVTGFFAEGEYHVGTTMAGDPLSADQIVRFWAIPTWPQGYDENGEWCEKNA